MPQSIHFRPDDLRGLSRLAIDGVTGATGLVETLHATIARPPVVFGKAGRTRGVTGIVYRSIGAVTEMVGGTFDAVLTPFSPLFGRHPSSPQREAVLAALNGVLGDHLEATDNPLALPMTLGRTRVPTGLQDPNNSIPEEPVSGKLMVFIHGLCLNDLQWAHGPAETLARETGHTAVYLHYNSGRHVGDNGLEFTQLLEARVADWPVPVTEIVLIGHSMGGLVARSACHCAAQSEHAWLGLLKHLVCLGSPHHGAPLERGGHGIDTLLELTPYSAPFSRLGKMRSAGIMDLRHGHLLNTTQSRPDPGSSAGAPIRTVPLPPGARTHVIAGRLGSALPGQLAGDGLVPVDSALGRHPDPDKHLPIPEACQWIARDTGHLGMLHEPAVYRQIYNWIAG